jgi:hypothetical protein
VSFRALLTRFIITEITESAKNPAGSAIPVETATCRPQGFGQIPHPAYAGFGRTKKGGQQERAKRIFNNY